MDMKKKEEHKSLIVSIVLVSLAFFISLLIFLLTMRYVLFAHDEFLDHSVILIYYIFFLFSVFGGLLFLLVSVGFYSFDYRKKTSHSYSVKKTIIILVILVLLIITTLVVWLILPYPTTVGYIQYMFYVAVGLMLGEGIFLIFLVVEYFKKKPLLPKPEISIEIPKVGKDKLSSKNFYLFALGISILIILVEIVLLLVMNPYFLIAMENLQPNIPQGLTLFIYIANYLCGVLLTFAVLLVLFAIYKNQTVKSPLPIILGFFGFQGIVIVVMVVPVLIQLFQSYHMIVQQTYIAGMRTFLTILLLLFIIIRYNMRKEETPVK